MIEGVLRACASTLGSIFDNADDFRFQVLLSEIVEDDFGDKRLVRHGFRLGFEYFYPASCIKLCAAVAALKKLDRLKHTIGSAISSSTAITFYPLEEGTLDESDATNLDGQKITVLHELRKLFLVSDNIAFNRLYDFVGHRCLNEAMWNVNLPSTRLRHHLSERSSSGINTANTCCKPLGFENVATIPPKRSRLSLPDNTPSQGLKAGTAYIAGGNLVDEPMDFSRKNCMTLVDLQNLLIKVTRPDIQLDDFPINLTDESSRVLLEAMSQYPGSSSNPKYNRSDYPDDFCKLFLPGLCRVRSKDALRIYNKVGRAFGFTTDNAYIVDVETSKSFFLAATIYTNANRIVNDDCYEYGIAEMAMADLAEALARSLWPEAVALSTRLDCTPSRQWEWNKPDLNAPEQSTTNQAAPTETEERKDPSKLRDIEFNPCPAPGLTKFGQESMAPPPPSQRYAYFLDE